MAVHQWHETHKPFSGDIALFCTACKRWAEMGDDAAMGSDCGTGEAPLQVRAPTVLPHWVREDGRAP